MRRAAPLILSAFAVIAVAGCASRGKEVFTREGCTNCHRFRDLGAGAIDLSDVGSRRDAAWITAQIGNPGAHNPTTRMPPFPHIRGLDLRSLVAFLRR